MHILHVIDTLRPGGAQRLLVEIANQTCAAGETVSVCITRDGCGLASKLRPEISVCVLERKHRFDWTAMRRLAAWVTANHVDLIHSHGRTSFSLLAFMKACGLLGAPIVMHDHTGSVRDHDTPPLWFRGWANQHVAQYVGVFDVMDAWAGRAHIPPARRSVIHGALGLSELGQNSADTTANIRQEFQPAPGVLLGICLGGVRPEKGIDTLLTATALSSRRRAFKIVVVGGVRNAAYWSQCLADIQRLRLEGEIILAGERLNVQGWHAQFDFAVHAARSESGPLAVIEHLAAGLPLICTRAGAIAARAERLGIERFVPPDDPAALAGALDELVDASPQQRKRRANAARQIAHRHFDIRSSMPAWREIYRRALRDGCPNPPASN